MSATDRSWLDDAACRDGAVDFYSNNREEQLAARALCEDCPVRLICLKKALDEGEYNGRWGGASEAELRRDQSIGADGKRNDSVRPIRCPNCQANSTRFLDVIEFKRTRTHIKCTNCDLDWWTKKIIGKKKKNW